MRQLFLPGLALSAWAVALLGCDSSTIHPVEPLGSGTLKVTITAPAGVKPIVLVDGPGGYGQTLVASQNLTGLAAGTYTVSAVLVTGSHPIVPTLYDPTVTGGTAIVNSGAVTASVTDGDTLAVTVSYAARPGTGALWVATGGVTIRSYSATALEAGGTPTSAGDLFINAAPIAIAFDGMGNLWAGANENDFSQWKIYKYPIDQLGTGLNADAVLVSVAPGASLQGMAFDGFGRLCVTNKNANTIVVLTEPGGEFNQVVTLSSTGGSLSGPAGIAFDANGDFWIANNTGNTIVKFTADQFVNSTTAAPTVTLSASNGSLDGPFGLAFDGTGNLWVTNRHGNTVVEFGASQLGTSGSPTPMVTLSASGGSLAGPSGMAFDPSGDLWVANATGGSVVKFGASQLTASGAPAPVATIGGLGPPGPFGPPSRLPADYFTAISRSKRGLPWSGAKVGSIRSQPGER